MLCSSRDDVLCQLQQGCSLLFRVCDLPGLPKDEDASVILHTAVAAHQVGQHFIIDEQLVQSSLRATSGKVLDCRPHDSKTFATPPYILELWLTAKPCMDAGAARSVFDMQHSTQRSAHHVCVVLGSC